MTGRQRGAVGRCSTLGQLVGVVVPIAVALGDGGLVAFYVVADRRFSRVGKHPH